MFKIRFILIILLLILPAVSFAINFIGEPGGGALDIKAFINKTVDIFWWIFVAGVVILFLIAGLTFLTAKGDTTKLEKAKLFALWGIIGIFVGVVGFSMVFIVMNFIQPPANQPQPCIQQGEACSFMGGGASCCEGTICTAEPDGTNTCQSP